MRALFAIPPLVLAISLAVSRPALAVEADDISPSRKEPTTVWIVEGALDHDDRRTESGCALKVHEVEPELPIGLRVAAHRDDLDCGAVYVFLDLPVDVHRERKTRWIRTTLDGISLKPPKRDVWRNVPALREAFVWLPSGRDYLEAVPLDDPEWSEPYRLAAGEKVEILAEDLAVLRTSTGRTVLVSGWWQKEEDPILERGGRQLRALRDRFTAGRSAHAGGGIIRDLPPSHEMLANLKDWKDHPFQMDLDPGFLSVEVFSPDWLDPVGQVWRLSCEDRRVRDDDPCGAYYLDYGAFGAWWPDNDTDVLVLLDGTQTVDGERLPRLRVVVREPWTRDLEVSPGWDGAAPAGPATR